jgi:transglutaminase-like putative cysteine protease
MLIRFGYEIVFDLPAAAAMVLLLSPHPSALSRLVGAETFEIEPHIDPHSFIDHYGNHTMRLAAPAGQLRLFYSAMIRDSGLPDIIDLDAQELAINQVPDDVLPFLLDSRYCEVELLEEAALRLFGDMAPGWARVAAVCDWVYSNVEFGYTYARRTRTAMDVFRERVGVCRDFTHLAVTFCRALNIPARYCNGYMGDIGVPPDTTPDDFNAWFEAYLGNRWYTFDARHNIPRIGRILVSRGRDAKDTAMTTTFGEATLKKFTVWTTEVVDETDVELANTVEAKFNDTPF